ncbi:hypothetical protein [Nonlabens agnitus]|uniref:hypothetical protein n=1 Tax=Nonlabens agnitus TaxID=870484 RepID=UPI0015583AF3|nr:hypothetical protein [Nonlabens agnitus]
MQVNERYYVNRSGWLRAGGSGIWKPVLRITFWGTTPMGMTALIGHLFDVNLA